MAENVDLKKGLNFDSSLSNINIDATVMFEEYSS